MNVYDVFIWYYVSMSDKKIALPLLAPEKDSVYQHYKGDLYRVIDLALHANDEEWMVVYSPESSEPGEHLFTRPLTDWHEEVEWEGARKLRFTKCS